MNYQGGEYMDLIRMINVEKKYKHGVTAIYDLNLIVSHNIHMLQLNQI